IPTGSTSFVFDSICCPHPIHRAKILRAMTDHAELLASALRTDQFTTIQALPENQGILVLASSWIAPLDERFLLSAYTVLKRGSAWFRADRRAVKTIKM